MSQYLPVLACPIMMGLMALVMYFRGNKNAEAPDPGTRTQQVAELESQIAELKAELRPNQDRVGS